VDLGRALRLGKEYLSFFCPSLGGCSICNFQLGHEEELQDFNSTLFGTDQWRWSKCVTGVQGHNATFPLLSYVIFEPHITLDHWLSHESHSR
jgi:hypothetical protein